MIRCPLPSKFISYYSFLPSLSSATLFFVLILKQRRCVPATGPCNCCSFYTWLLLKKTCTVTSPVRHVLANPPKIQESPPSLFLCLIFLMIYCNFYLFIWHIICLSRLYFHESRDLCLVIH